MKSRQKSYLLELLLSLLFIVIAFSLFIWIFFLPPLPKETIKLCAYEIPNHLRFECPADNDTRIINSFESSILYYQNAINDYNCTLEGVGDGVKGNHFEINLCDLGLPFNSTKIDTSS